MKAKIRTLFLIYSINIPYKRANFHKKLSVKNHDCSQNYGQKTLYQAQVNTDFVRLLMFENKYPEHFFYIRPEENVDTYGAVDVNGFVRSALFLKSNILITSGDGSSNTPYQLGL